MKSATLTAVLALAALSACSRPAPQAAPGNDVGSLGAPQTEVAPEPTPTAAAARSAADYVGRWKSVEGTYLLVKPGNGDAVELEMQWDLDHHGNFAGRLGDSGISFIRGGVVETAKTTDGDATGLKYLAGKKDCLTVKAGEGYCRD